MSLNLGTAVAYLEMDTSNFTSGLKSASEDLKKFGDGTNTVEDRIRGLSGALGSVGSTLTKTVTVPLVGVGTAAVKTAADFEAQMSKVKAISGATGSDFESLREKAIEMGASTKFSATESAQAFEYMAMAGWKTEDMLNGIEGIMNLAAASGEDLATTSDIVTDALTAFGMSAADSGRFADILAAASANANTNVSLLGESFKYVAPVAGAMGYSADDVAQALGLMANSGIKASMAGTSLRTMMTNLAKPTDTVQSAMDRLGITLDDGEGNMLAFSEIMQQLREGFGSMKMPLEEYTEAVNELTERYEEGELEEDAYTQLLEELTEQAYGAEGAMKAQAAASLAGKTGMAGLLAIVNASEDDYNKLAAAIANSTDEQTGYSLAAEQAEIMIDNLKGSFTLLGSAMESAGIIIGDRIAPYVRELAEWVKGLVEQFNALSPEQQDQIVKWGLIAAAVGPVILIISKLLGVVATIIGVITKIGAAIGGLINVLGSFGTVLSFLAANPIVLVVTAIGLLVAALVYLWNTSEDFQNFFRNMWEGIKNITSSVGEAVGKFFTETFPGFFKSAGESIGEFFSGLGEWFSGIPGAIAEFFSGLGKTISEGIPESFKSIGEAIKTFFTETIPGFFSGVGGTFIKIKDTVVGFFSTIKDGIISFVSGPFTAIKEFFETGVNAILTPVKEIGGKITGFFNNAVNAISDAGGRIAGAFDSTFGEAGRSIGRFFTETIPGFFNNFSLSTIPEFISNIDFSELPYKMGYAVGEMLGHLYLFATDAWNWVTVDLPEIISEFVGRFAELPELIGEWLSKTLESVTEWGGNLIETGKEVIGNFISNVGEFLSQLPEKFSEKFGEVIEGIKTWGAEILENGKAAAANFIENVSNVLKEFPGKVKIWFDENISNLITWAGEVWNNAREAGSNFINSIAEYFSQLPGKIKNWFDQTIENTIAWFTNMTAKAMETGTVFLNNVVQFFSELPGKVAEKLSEVYNRVVSWGSEMISKGSEIATSFINNVVTTIKELPGKIMETIKSIPEKILEIKNSMKEAGKGIITSLFDGIKEIGNTVLSWIKGFASSIKSFVSGILSGFKDVVSGANAARSAANSVNGSHANGLDYVPFNGYIAELHEGERVLTKQENEAYSNGTGRSEGDTFIFYNTQPTPYEYARQMKKAKTDLLYGT